MNFIDEGNYHGFVDFAALHSHLHARIPIDADFAADIAARVQRIVQIGIDRRGAATADKERRDPVRYHRLWYHLSVSLLVPR